jgi:hypothetical protein
LLTAGKSLIGLQNVTSRYRMRSRFLLPKFGAAKNPFASDVSDVSEAVPEPAPEVRPMSEEEVAAANLKETKRLPVAPPALIPRGLAPTVKRESIFERILKLNPLAWWKSWRTPARRPLPRPSRATPVQGELSLDKITVVRNDLTDADLEIVPAKTPAEPKTRPLPKTEEAGLLKG